MDRSRPAPYPSVGHSRFRPTPPLDALPPDRQDARPDRPAAGAPEPHPGAAVGPARGERVARVAFLVSLVVLSVLYGSYGATQGWFPVKLVRKAEGDIRNLAANWRNDFALEPTRHVVPANDPEREPYRVLLPDELTPGLVLTAGLTPGRETLQGATLYAADGTEVHRWAIDYDELVPDGVGEFNVLAHGVAPYPDGSIVVAFDAGEALARIDACGDPMWIAEGGYHHVVSPNGDGTLWSWDREELVLLDADSGEELDRIDFRAEVLEANDLYGALAIRSSEDIANRSFGYFADMFHFNDVEALTDSMADAFPMFEAGDLLVSLRELNLVGVLRPETRELLWYRHGPWFKQHDPDFLSDGTIGVYDNRMGLDASRIVAVDPATDRIEDLLVDTPDTPFYSWRRGKWQPLPGGNLLVTESERGRVFEATADGRLVRDWNMIHDEATNYLVTSAELVGTDFFDPGALDCPPADAPMALVPDASPTL